MTPKREDHELPQAFTEWGWKYHHLGIPTNQFMDGETYIPQFKFWVSGFSSSPFGVEWMRFEDDSPIHPLIQQVPHLAFEVNNIEEELARHVFNVLTPPNSPATGIKVAMIEHNGAPIELIEFDQNKSSEQVFNI